jgi:hypothetical protein
MDSGGGFLFRRFSPSGPKRNKNIPEDTLLKNGDSIECSFIRTVDRLDRKRGKLPPDRRDFKFQFNERERSQGRSAIFSFLKGLKRA